MKRKRLIVRIPKPDREFIEYASDNPGIDGVVIGDPFSLKRAGITLFDIVKLCRLAKDKGLFVSYQSPVYLTSRNFDLVNDLIGELIKENIVDEIRVQEPGLLRSLSGKMPENVKLLWSIYGYQREFPGMDIPINQAQLDFLSSKGIDSFEITTAVAFSIMENRYPLNFKKQVYHYRFDPASFSRLCYTGAYTGRCCEDEGTEGEKPCDKIYFLKDDNGEEQKYVVEGHRVLEFAEPGEFEELMESDFEAEALVIEERNLNGLKRVVEFEPVSLHKKKM